MTLFSRADGAIKSFIIRLLFLNGQSLRRWRGKVESTIVRRVAQVKLLEWARLLQQHIYLRAAHSLFIAPPYEYFIINFHSCKQHHKSEHFSQHNLLCFWQPPLLATSFLDLWMATIRTISVGMQCVCFAAAVELNQYQPALPQKCFELNRKSSASGPLLTEKLNIHKSSRYTAQNFLIVASFCERQYKKCVAWCEMRPSAPNTQSKSKKQKASESEARNSGAERRKNYLRLALFPIESGRLRERTELERELRSCKRENNSRQADSVG